MTYNVSSCPLSLSHPGSHFPFVKYFHSCLLLMVNSDYHSHCSSFATEVIGSTCWQVPLAASCGVEVIGQLQQQFWSGTQIGAHSRVLRAVSSELLGRTL